MIEKGKPPSPNKLNDRDLRARLARVRVLLADRDHRTTLLVKKILFSFGFRNLDLCTSGEAALEKLRVQSYDLIITEFNMAPIDGVSLVKAIRAAKNDRRIKRDVPIIMLTAHSEKDRVQAARDAGINEFVAKPFSARTISNRIIRVVDYPRAFIDTPAFSGPCRRRKGEPPVGVDERRVRPDTRTPKQRMETPVSILPPNASLRELIGMSATDVLTEEIILEAQRELMESENEFIEWAKQDIVTLNEAYAKLEAAPGDAAAQKALYDAAYTIKGLAGTFGYELGTTITGMLLDYLEAHHNSSEGWLLVIRKHIDAVTVIFSQKIKDAGTHIGVALLESLQKLIKKLG